MRFFNISKIYKNKTNVFIPTTYLMSRSFNQIALNIIIEIILIFLRVLLKMNNWCALRRRALHLATCHHHRNRCDVLKTFHTIRIDFEGEGRNACWGQVFDGYDHWSVQLHCCSLESLEETNETHSTTMTKSHTITLFCESLTRTFHP